ncbi:MAG: hypothetical protein ICV60_11495 [Pyrinomonadaceae bacterium]|nr:hypothetical protein [Pyrinomonadaceae bacterium]
MLEQAIGEMLQGQFGIHASGEMEDVSRMTHLSSEDQQYREQVLVHLEHIRSSGLKPKDAVAQLVREVAFTHLNRLCAYKMMEARGIIQKSVSDGINSRGFIFYLSDNPEEEKLWSGGQQDVAYRHYLEWLGGTLSEEIGVLFSPQDLANRLFPPHRVLEKVLELVNSEELQAIWTEDEAIGWVYQYFTPKELRDAARDIKRGGSAAPRNSYEMAFRNQFFTPRYVVEFLTDNTLGRTWYEMREGDTALKEKCRYLAVEADGKNQSSTSKVTRQKKDPREIKVLDPACGSGHFLLYCFDLFQTIYEEAYADAELGPKLQQDFPDEEEFKRQIPGLILAHNLHGIDIDLRVTQLAALALWLRAQRAFQEMGLKSNRPQIKRMNLVCAEPMPGEEDLLEEFVSELGNNPLGGLIGDLVRNVFKRMKLAGEAGALIRIEDDISGPIEEARRAWQEMLQRQAQREHELAEKGALFDYKKEEAQQRLVFSIADITSEKVWDDAEEEALQALRAYARRASNGKGLLWRLFAEDTEQGFAFIDLCRQKFDVVLMNPPFGDASNPSKPYIDETYGDTKGDVYKAFVECFQDRLVPGGLLGIISSRTGFFLSGSSDWRERIVLRLYRPLVLADFGMGVLDAMVETAAYVLRSLTPEEDRQLTLQLAKNLSQAPTDKNDLFSTKKYEETFGLKRHQANGELRRLYDAGFIKPIEGRFPRWSPLHGEIAKAPAPSTEPYPLLICLRLLSEEYKGRALYEALYNENDPRRFVVSPEDFRQVPNIPFCYWVSNRIRKLFTELSPFESNGRAVRVGVQTSDDFRFVRTWWEVPTNKLCPPLAHPDKRSGAYCVRGDYRWFPFAKGGSYSPYYSDIHLVVNWELDGEDIRNFVDPKTGRHSRPQNTEFFFRPGLTWTLRTQIGFNMRRFPRGAGFSNKGSVAFVEESQLTEIFGITNSKVFETLLSLQISFGSYEVGVIQRTPLPEVSGSKAKQLSQLSTRIIGIKLELDAANETSHVFHLPALLQVNGDILTKRIAAWQARVSEAERQLAANQREIDDIAFHLYGISDEDRRSIEASAAGSASSVTDGEESETDDEAEDEQTPTGERQLMADFISYTIGCTFGRWDMRFVTGERPAPELPDPFAPLPVCAPGALTGEDGLPLSQTPEGYPLRVDPDGLLVDDASHTDDIIARVREVFELLWPTAAEACEREACELLGVKELRDYFRKPGAGGFWTDHVKRYSKSRRKAPIYWLLRSAKGNYAIWLYYHRLDKDSLFKALLTYVEPKLRFEDNALTQLRSRRDSAGTGGREAKQLERQLERQEAFLSELRDFRDKLQRAANLYLEPDLNDGVVLNIASLWELVPWPEAKKYWNDLLEGKYEWSSISKQLRERGLLKSK